MSAWSLTKLQREHRQIYIDMMSEEGWLGTWTYCTSPLFGYNNLIWYNLLIELVGPHRPVEQNQQLQGYKM